MSYRISQVDSDYHNRQTKKESGSKKFPKCYKVKVNIEKVNLDVIKQWISKTINQQLEDDDIVIDYVYELIQSGDSNPDIKAIQLQLEDFLGANEAKTFCEKLWNLLISAQQNEEGIPQQIWDERRKHEEEAEQFQLEMKKKLAQAARKVDLDSKKTNYNRSQSDKEPNSKEISTNSTNSLHDNDLGRRGEASSELYKSDRRGRTVYNASKYDRSHDRSRSRDRHRHRDNDKENKDNKDNMRNRSRSRDATRR